LNADSPTARFAGTLSHALIEGWIALNFNDGRNSQILATQYAKKDIQELLDREAIRDVLYRYARGIDRCAETLLNSVYWPDGIDEHGDFNGIATGFVAWVVSAIRSGVDCTLHLMGNSLIRIDGRSAAVETYCQAFHRYKGQPSGRAEDMIAGGRYVYRMEKRGMHWRIAHRIVAFDYSRKFNDTGNWTNAKYLTAKRVIGSRTPEDPSDLIFGSQLLVPPFRGS